MLGVSGFLTGLTLICPTVLGWLEWVTIIPAALTLLLTVRSLSVRRTWRVLWRSGFGFFFPFYLVVFHWFWYLYPLDFTGLTPVAAAAVMLVAWLGLALFQGAGMSFCFVAIGSLWRCEFAQKHPMFQPLIAGAVFTVAEWLQTLGWFGVPWGRLSLGQVTYLPLVQTASWFGCYGITFLLVTVNFALAQAIMIPQGVRRGLCTLACGLFVGNLLAGSVLFIIGENRTPDDTLTVGVVQGNLGSDDKWELTMAQTVTIHEEYTESILDRDPDLVLWPETALPFLVQDYPRYMTRVQELAEHGNLTLCTGTFIHDDDGTEHSSVLTFLPDGTLHEEIYHKRHLVPFGEFVPMRKLVTTLIPPLADLNMWETDLGAGTDATVVEDKNGAYGFLICFDSIYEELARASVRGGAQLLLLPTNDSWFLDSAASVMHLGQARLRAIENGRGIVRAANTGISALITPTGKVTAELGTLTEGTLVGELPLCSHTTLYNLLGNWFVYVCLAGLLLVTGDEIYRRMRR